MLLTMRGIVAPLVGRDGEAIEFGVSLAARARARSSGAVLLAGFLAAGMMVLASFARTFREGQSMVTPFYLAAILLPAMFLSTPGITLTLPLALVPVVNIALVVREAISGTFKPLETLVAVVATLAAIAAAAPAGHVRSSPSRMSSSGSYSGSLATFLRAAPAWRGRGPDHEDAMTTPVEVSGLTQDLRRRRAAAAVRAVDGIDFDCRPGEIFGLLGANGAGKTTTLRMLATILVPDGRNGARDGVRRRSATPEEVRRQLGFYSASTALYPRLTARETLEFFARINGYPRGAPARRASAQLVARFGIAEYADTRVDRALAGHEAEGVDRPDDRARSAGADLRRADGGPRRAQRARDAAGHRRAAERGQDDHLLDAHHERGRAAVRSDRDHPPRPHPRLRHAASAARGDRPPLPRGHLRALRPGGRRSPPRGPCA